MYGWSESIQATAMLTDSCGFMMIQGSCQPQFVNDMARVCLLHLLKPASVTVRAYALPCLPSPARTAGGCRPLTGMPCPTRLR